MQWIRFGLIVIAVFQHVEQLKAKLSQEHTPKSSEMLSNAVYNTNKIFDNDISALRQELEQEQKKQEQESDFNAVDHNNDKLKTTNTNQKQTNAIQDITTDDGEVVYNSNNNSNNNNSENNNTSINYSNHSNKGFTAAKSISNKSAMTSTKIQHTMPTKTTATTTTSKTSSKNTTNSISSKSSAPPAPNAKLYYPNSFVNPFGQLVAFFGSDQLHLQDYNFLFNAERHTVFQLHTSVPQTNAVPVEERVLHVVSGTIGAAFGVSPPPAAGGGGAGGGVAAAVPSTKVEEVQLYSAASLRQSRFNPFNPTRILIHGWMGGSHAGIYNTIIPEYLKLGGGNYNVFTVDWGRGAIADYITASYRVKPVGKVVAKFIDFLHREAGMNYADLHVVGFSMGAHVAGIAGKHVQASRIPVIYALDPALPFFRYENLDERVVYTDADYVEVIHTSVGSYGYDRPLGHVDFYVNYGSGQPGCLLNECSHMRAFQVFAEALQSGGLWAQGCDVQLWQDMTRNRRCLLGSGRNLSMGGDPLDVAALKRRGGIYYLLSSTSAPYIGI